MKKLIKNKIILLIMFILSSYFVVAGACSDANGECKYHTQCEYAISGYNDEAYLDCNVNYGSGYVCCCKSHYEPVDDEFCVYNPCFNEPAGTSCGSGKYCRYDGLCARPCTDVSDRAFCYSGIPANAAEINGYCSNGYCAECNNDYMWNLQNACVELLTCGTSNPEWGDGCVYNYATANGIIGSGANGGGATMWCQQFDSNHRCIDCNPGFEYKSPSEGCVKIPCTPNCPEKCGQDDDCGGICPYTDISTCGKCGNDPYIRTCQNYFTSGNLFSCDSSSKCCNRGSDALYNNVCYGNQDGFYRGVYQVKTSGNDKIAAAIQDNRNPATASGKWVDCDKDDYHCALCGGVNPWSNDVYFSTILTGCSGWACWVKSGELSAHGEYSAKGDGCCGDDDNEVYRTGFTTACCNNNYDCVDESGDCKTSGQLNDAGTHTCQSNGGWLVNCPSAQINTRNAGCRTSAPSFSSTRVGYCSSGTCYVCNTGYHWSGSNCVPDCTPVNGDWSSWSNLGSCGQYASCKQRQTRTCTNPTPSCDGTDCIGSNTRDIDCSTAEICTGGKDEDCDGHIDGEDASCIYVTSVTAPSSAYKDTPFTVTCGISSTTASANCVGARIVGGIDCSKDFIGWSGSSPQFSCISSSTGLKTVECYISNKAGGSCTLGTDTGTPPSSSKTKPIEIISSDCSARSQSQCTDDCKWCSSCSGKQSYTGTSQCIQSTSVCGYSCTKTICTAVCDANDGPCCSSSCEYKSSSTSCGTKDCDYLDLDIICRDYHDKTKYCTGLNPYCPDTTCDSYTNTASGTSCGTNLVCDGNGNCIKSCLTSGTCTASSNICDTFWCSSGNVCHDEYKWNPILRGGLGDCEQAAFCGDTCPYTPSQPQYFSTPSCFSGSYSCCQVNYGTPTTDWVKIEVKPPE